MKKIVIHVQNEEMEALKPFAKRLAKSGANSVVFSALKYMEFNPKAELVLTLDKYLNSVKTLYRDNGHSVPVMTIEDLDDSPPALIEAEVPVMIVPEVEVTDTEVVVAIEAEVSPNVASEAEEAIVISVGDAEEPVSTPVTRRVRRVKED